MPKQYKLSSSRTSLTRLSLESRFRDIASKISSLGMVLKRDAIPIAREFDVAYQSMVCKPHGFLCSMVLSASDVKSFVRKMDEVGSEIAMHSHTASVIKEIKALRNDCVLFIESQPHSKVAVPAKKATPTPEPGSLSSQLHARMFEGEVWIKLSDVAAAFNGALAHYAAQAPEELKNLKQEK